MALDDVSEYRSTHDSDIPDHGGPGTNKEKRNDHLGQHAASQTHEARPFRMMICHGPLEVLRDIDVEATGGLVVLLEVC